MSVFGEELLSSPDLFPARLAGEPWGDEALEIELPGGAYRLGGLAAAQAGDLGSHFGNACHPPAETGPGQAEVRVFWAPAEDFREPATARAPGAALPEYRLDVDVQPRALRLAGQGFMGRIEWTGDGGLRGALWTCRAAGPGFCETVENLLRVLSAYRLLDHRGALIHSAALVRDGEALLFPGRSGAGKSTLCGLAAGAGFAVLSDELNVLRLGDGGGARVEQVPFAGDFGRAPARAGAFPLRAVVLLRQAPGDRAAPASEAAAFGALLAAAPYVNQDPFRGPRLEPLLEAAVRAVPAWTLEFSLDGRLAGLEAVLPEAVAS